MQMLLAMLIPVVVAAPAAADITGKGRVVGKRKADAR